MTLAYAEAGSPDAPPMVLLHGGGNDRTAWDQVLPAFAQTHRVYALDLRGFGESGRPGAYSFELMRDDVLGFLDALGLDRIVLIGHSMGGTVAWLLAQDHPDRLTHLVIEDVAPNRPGDEPVDDISSAETSRRPFDYDALAAIFAQLNDPDPAWTTRLTRDHHPDPDRRRRRGEPRRPGPPGRDRGLAAGRSGWSRSRSGTGCTAPPRTSSSPPCKHSSRC